MSAPDWDWPAYGDYAVPPGQFEHRSDDTGELIHERRWGHRLAVATRLAEASANLPAPNSKDFEGSFEERSVSNDL